MKPMKQRNRKHVKHFQKLMILASAALCLFWTGASLGSGVRVSGHVSGHVEVGASLNWGSHYDPYEVETFSSSIVDIRVIPDWYGDRWEYDRDPYITIHVRPYEPAHLLIFGVTEWGELILLYPSTPTDRIFYEPAMLHISMVDYPWVCVEDMTIFAVSAPYSLLPHMPRYLVPDHWFHLGFHYSHHRGAIRFGHVYEWTGFYWVIGDPHQAGWYICNDFWWASGCRGRRPALGHRVFHPRNRRRHVRHYPDRPRPPHIRHKTRERYQDVPRHERPGRVRAKPNRPNPDKPRPVRIQPKRPTERPGRKEKPGHIDRKSPHKKPEKRKMKQIKVEKKEREKVREKTRVEKRKKADIKKKAKKPTEQKTQKRAEKPKKQKKPTKPKKDKKKAEDRKGKPRSR